MTGGLSHFPGGTDHNVLSLFHFPETDFDPAVPFDRIPGVYRQVEDNLAKTRLFQKRRQGFGSEIGLLLGAPRNDDSNQIHLVLQ